MFQLFNRIILASIFLASSLANNAFANTTIYKKNDLKVNVTGYLDSQAGFTNSSNNTQNRHNIYGGFAIYDKIKDVKTSVALRINNGSNALQSYGGTAIEDAYLRIGDGSTDSDDRFLNFEEESDGRLEFGITGTMTEKLRVSTTEFSRGTGGVSGDWFRYFRYDLDSSTTILNPQMPITNGFTTSSYAAPVSGVLQDYYSGSQALKLNLYSPKFNGFLVGIGFTPSLYDRYAIIGLKNSYDQMTSDPNNNFNSKNSISSVIYYDKKLTKDFQLTSSLLWEKGSTVRLNNNYDYSPRENLNAWMLGLAAAYQDWHFGGSYSNYGKSLYLKSNGTAETMKLNKDGSLSNFSKAYFYDLGLGYSKKDWGTSLTYFASEYTANQVSTIMLSFDKYFTLTNSSSIKTYVETGYANIKHNNFYNISNEIISSNKKAGIIFGGLRLNF